MRKMVFIITIMLLSQMLIINPVYGQMDDGIMCGATEEGGTRWQSWLPSNFDGKAVVLFGWIPGNWHTCEGAMMHPDSVCSVANDPDYCVFCIDFNDLDHYDPECVVGGPIPTLALPTWAQSFADMNATSFSVTNYLKEQSKVINGVGDVVSSFKMRGVTPENNGNFFTVIDPDPTHPRYNIRDWMDQDEDGTVDHLWYAMDVSASSYCSRYNSFDDNDTFRGDATRRLLEIADQTINFAEFDNCDNVTGNPGPDGIVDFVFVNMFMDH